MTTTAHGDGPPGDGRIFYGWWVTGSAFLAYFFSNGVGIFVPPTLYPRFLDDFAASTAEVSLTAIITLVLSGILAPFAGHLIDRIGPIKAIRGGIIVLALSASLYPFAGTLWHLYILHAGFAVGLAAAGLMANVVLLSNWFETKRGRAVGLLVTGSSLGGFLLPNVIAGLVVDPAYGWRWGMALLALMLWLIAVPAVFLVMKASPSEVNQNVDGRMRGPVADDTAAGPKKGVTFLKALRTRTLWCLALGSFCLWLSITALNNQLQLFLESEAGLSIRQATLFYSFTLLFSVAGKFLFGFLSDFLPKRTALLLASSLLLIGCLALFTPSLELTTNLYQLFLFTILFGLGFGGSFTMIQMVCVESFGQRELGKIYGVIILIDTLGAGLGIGVVSSLKDITGSYLMPFGILTGVAALALVNMWFVRPLVSGPQPSVADLPR